MRWCVGVALGLAIGVMAPAAASAQSGDSKSAEQQRQQGATLGDAAKERKRRLAEYAEAAKVLQNRAGNPECMWLGQRVVGLISRDDLDTAFRHLDLYDRFGCPGEHVQVAFRCVVLLGEPDPKQSDTLNSRVHACWLHPDQPEVEAPPPATASAPAAPGAPTKQ